MGQMQTYLIWCKVNEIITEICIYCKNKFVPNLKNSQMLGKSIMMLICIFWTGAKRQQAPFCLEKFQEKLKKSVAVGSTSVHDDSLPNTEREVAEQMTAFNAAIGSNSRQNTYNYCMIGRNLGELQKGGKRGKKLGITSNVISRQNSTVVAKFIFWLTYTNWHRNTTNLCMWRWALVFWKPNSVLWNSRSLPTNSFGSRLVYQIALVVWHRRIGLHGFRSVTWFWNSFLPILFVWHRTTKCIVEASRIKDLLSCIFCVLHNFFFINKVVI